MHLRFHDPRRSQVAPESCLFQTPIVPKGSKPEHTSQYGAGHDDVGFRRSAILSASRDIGVHVAIARREREQARVAEGVADDAEGVDDAVRAAVGDVGPRPDERPEAGSF